MYKKFCLMLIILFLLTSCSKNAVEDNDGNLSGIKIGPAELNENNESVHNIYNLNPTEKKVRITTLCYNQNMDVIDNSDTYVMVLAADSVSGWKPDCPEGTVKYHIDFEIVD